MNRFVDKVVVITGAASGIGLACARRFSDEGARVVLVDVVPGIVETAADFGGHGIVADVATDASYIDAVLDKYGALDVLVPNAAIGGPIGPLVKTSVEDFDRVYGVNVRGVFLAMQAAIPRMKPGSAVVVTSSILGLRGTKGGGAYVASKHAITGLCKVAAIEHARDGVRVNTVHPGMVDTQLARDMETAISPDDLARGRALIERSIPMRRYAAPEDIAAMVLFLASEDARHCTGAAFTVDGGQTAL